MSWTGIAIVVGLLVIIVLMVDHARHPRRRVPRDKVPYWILSLMRFYEDSAIISVALEKSYASLFRLRLTDTIGDKCDLVFEIVDRDLMSRYRARFLEVLEKQGFESVENGGAAGGADPVAVRITVDDVWQSTAGDRAAYLANGLLDVAEVDREARLKLSFRGRKSLDRVREGRRRQTEGDLEAFPGYVQETELQRRVREKFASWLLPK